MATTGTLKRTSARLLDDAVHQSSPLSAEGIRERLFTLAFRGLVYPQIWEDPVVDLEALQVKPSDRMVAIASGGCNVLSYLSANPAHITALDLNAAHVALNRLKRCALKQLDDHETFYRFFGEANCRSNVAVYRERLKPHLDADTRKYWEGRDFTGRRRISRFGRGSIAMACSDGSSVPAIWRRGCSVSGSTTFSMRTTEMNSAPSSSRHSRRCSTGGWFSGR